MWSCGVGWPTEIWPCSHGFISLDCSSWPGLLFITSSGIRGTKKIVGSTDGPTCGHVGSAEKQIFDPVAMVFNPWIILPGPWPSGKVLNPLGDWSRWDFFILPESSFSGPLQDLSWVIYLQPFEDVDNDVLALEKKTQTIEIERKIWRLLDHHFYLHFTQNLKPLISLM